MIDSPASRSATPDDARGVDDRGEGPRRRRNRRTLAVVALALAAATLLLAQDSSFLRGGPRAVQVEASSSAAGTDAQDLLTAAADIAEPTALAAPSIEDGVTADTSDWHAGDVTWQSTDGARGTALTVTWPSAVTVSHVRLDGAGGPSHAYTAAVITFEDGSTVWVTPDSRGNVSMDIEPRSTTTAQVQFVDGGEGADTVALRAIAFDDSGADLSSIDPHPVVSDDTAGPASSLVDGDIAAGDGGDAWSTTETDPWAGLAWDSPTPVSSVQILGVPGADGPLHGTLEFSDGSTIVVSGVTAAEDGPTTLAFTTRTVTWVRFVAEGAGAELGELRAYAPGTTPPTWPLAGTEESASTAASSCDSSTEPVGSSSGSAPALVCPAVGSSVGDSATIVVAADPGATLTATAWSPETSELVAVGTAQVGDDGTATLSIDMTGLLQGPMAIAVDSDGSDTPLYVQLDNTSGITAEDDGYAPAGMTLQYEDDFTSPLSVSRLGAGTAYAATKPTSSGASEFSDSVFADPAWGTDTLTTLDDDYLRITLTDLGDREDPFGWGRDDLGGIVSSARVGSSGFAAQYGYFEARILAPAGLGTWSAFWMLDTESVRKSDEGAGEVDAVELYGHNPRGSCHTIHNWASDTQAIGESCFDDNGEGDWALRWHTYGVLIHPDGADMYIDGTLVASKSRLDRDTLPYYFLLNLASGGGWPVDLSTTGKHVEMYVDWVRVYS
ncbi:glycoside hydrolase family 16 protein [Demequina salsinemoris]|uniref:glycoside hydrolase family 16 protein n=1 Tax=Demequina salsinemoris TaxID=577470 RepID=UPI0007823A24|nr:glycoside hydrolase family 16 protein [Demequina salsinemoris]